LPSGKLQIVHVNNIKHAESSRDKVNVENNKLINVKDKLESNKDNQKDNTRPQAQEAIQTRFGRTVRRPERYGLT
jgi:hypothetical protein